ncbi:MAG: hypothetical protein M3373_00395 [Gemmatimonadota bacterium]|nr:hypothetical protein [Gemmatimonadota bacterium]
MFHSRITQRRPAATSGRLRIPMVAFGLAAFALTAPALLAQEERDPSVSSRSDSDAGGDTTTWHRVRGRVVRPAGGAARGVPGAWVVLHRVGPDGGAPLDSLRTATDGQFDFRYRATASADAIYFVSAEHADIAYFTPPLRGVDVSGEEAEITVFDTTSAPIPLVVRGRHFIVSAPAAAGERTVVEVLELSNDTTVTLISPDDARPTWTASLAEGASDFRAGQGDVAADALQYRDGQVRVIAPFAPGLKQVNFTYTLPASSFPLSVPVEGGAEVLEVLVEDSTTVVSGARLAEVAPVNVEGRTFRRWMANDVPRNAVVRLVPHAAVASRMSLYAVGIALAAGVAVLAALAFNRRQSRAPVTTIERGAAVGGPDAIARAIADLDHRFEQQPDPSPRARAEYDGHRTELKRRLAAALEAARDRG